MFSTPWAFLLLLPWAVACWRIWRTARTKGVVFASAQRRFAGIKPSFRQRLCRLLPAFFLLGTLFLIVGAAGPRTLLSREVRSADALAVMMAMDISGSMRALDLSEGRNDVTRLDVVKQVFQKFVAARPEDLIGVVTFGGYASVRSPLTADHRALQHLLGGITIPGEKGDVDERGRPISQEELLTAIGDGLAVSLKRVKDAEPKTKIVILLSDGENNTGAVTPLEAAKAAAALGVRVYTIGVGSTGIAKVRATDVFGREVLGDMRTVLDEETLKKIAEISGAEYANVREPEQMEAFLQHIAELETTQVERQIYARYASQARPWLLSGVMCCLVAASLLTAWIRRPI
ncbi:MAG: VWA domain-containing protein [Kiritimatiellae bacterium]|nr:VWA domain-containing protein [Kiritimatiellia bacterium]